ncbi:alanine racemase [Eudoraea adriatica]|uniref:alanine racemase n=1 Tax=Eudoraea adriatica TaxID=446681 RepID=UPI00035CEACD|nr:alanine racemase [Eudoraea adriatica]
MPRAEETTLELDLAALEHNYNYIKSKLHPSTRLLAVVKAFAYGSDSVIIAKKLEKMDVDYLAVAYAREGMVLREAGIKTPILVLHAQPLNYSMVIKYCLEPSLYSPRVFREFLKAARAEKQKAYPVHLKFNTGLNRLGFSENDIDYIADTILDRDELKIKSIFSHLAASEDKSEESFSNDQINCFIKIAEEFTAKLRVNPFMHILNTSGILNFPEAQFQMVRTGIGLYGYGNEARFDSELLPVATLKTTISQIHYIEPNESVGYNRAFRSEGYQKTATLPLGHADGIGRQYGNGKGSVLINGKKAPIIGNVCMDMIMIDVSNIECNEGDEVILFGKGHSAETFAAGANTISYEVLSGISQRVKRVIIGT